MVRLRLLDSRFGVASGTPARSGTCGNNSVVECDLAKVEVAGSNPVSRSNIETSGPVGPPSALHYAAASSAAPFRALW